MVGGCFGCLLLRAWVFGLLFTLCCANGCLVCLLVAGLWLLCFCGGFGD